METRHVALTREGDFAVVTMSRPERRNALSEDHLRELLDALLETGETDARGIILAAQGPVFSAGHDFNDMDGRDVDGMKRLFDLCRQVMRGMQSLPQPVVAQVEGLATAAGCQLVASCDLAVAGLSARFAVPGGRGGWFCTTPGVAVARAIGRKRAAEMLLTGDPIDAVTAERWGLVNRAVPDDLVAEETRALLKRASRGSAESKGIGKRAFYHQIELDIDSAYDYAGQVMAESSQTEDAVEGRRAFIEKRRPRFRS